jgi:hypothetical protein
LSRNFVHWSHIYIIRLVLGISVALVCCDAVHAFDKGAPINSFKTEYIVDRYIRQAFSNDGSDVRLHVLSKYRYGEVPVVFPLPNSSVVTTNEELLSIVERVKSVGDHINLKSEAGPIAKFLSKREFEAKLTTTEGVGTAKDGIVNVFIGDNLSIRSIIKNNNANVTEVLKNRVLSAFDASDGITSFCAAFSYLDESNPGVITGASILIEFGDDFEACLYEQIMQSFGLWADFPPGTQSLFAEDELFTSPTELDWLIWRLHTSRELKAGAGREEVREIATVLVNNWLGRN